MLFKVLIVVALVGSVQPFKFLLKPQQPTGEPQPPGGPRPQLTADMGLNPSDSYYVAPILWPPSNAPSYSSPVSAYRQSDFRYGYQPETRAHVVPRSEPLSVPHYNHYQSPSLAYLVVRPMPPSADYQQLVPSARYASNYDRSPFVRQALSGSTKGGESPRWQQETKGQEPVRVQQEIKEPPRLQQEVKEPPRIQQETKEPPRIQSQEVKEPPRAQQEIKGQEPQRLQPAKGQQAYLYRQELDQQQQEQENEGQQPLPPAQPQPAQDQADLINQYYAIKQSKLSKLKHSLNRFAAAAKSKLTLGSSYQVVSEEIIPQPPGQPMPNPDEQQQVQQQEDQLEQQEQEREIQQQSTEATPIEQERQEPVKSLPPRIEQVQAQIKSFALPNKQAQQPIRQQHEIKDLHPSPTSDESFTPQGSDLRREHSRPQLVVASVQAQAQPPAPVAQPALQPVQPVQHSPVQPVSRPSSAGSSSISSVATN